MLVMATKRVSWFLTAMVASGTISLGGCQIDPLQLFAGILNPGTANAVVQIAQLTSYQEALANAKAEMDQCAARIGSSASGPASQLSNQIQSLIDEGNQPFGNAQTSTEAAFADWKARARSILEDAWDVGLECGEIIPGQGPDYPDPNSTFWSFFPTG